MAARPWEACGEIKFQFAARSKEPNSPVAFHTGKDGPRGTPRGGGPLGGAPRGAPGGGPAWERLASRNDSDYFTFIFHADSVPRGGGPRGGGPRPLPPGPRGGGPRLWESTSVREVRLSTTIPGNFDFYTVLCGGAPRGGGPRGGGPLGGGPRGGGPRGGPPMVFYARGCPLVPSGCIRSENGPRPATLLQRDRTKSFRQQQRRGAAYAPKNLAASGPLLLQVGALAAA